MTKEFLLTATISSEESGFDPDKFCKELKEFCFSKNVDFTTEDIMQTSLDCDPNLCVRPITCHTCSKYSDYCCGAYGENISPDSAWEGTCECNHYYSESDDVMYLHFTNPDTFEDESWLVENNTIVSEAGYLPWEEMKLEDIVTGAATWIKEIEDILSEVGFVAEQWELRETD